MWRRASQIFERMGNIRGSDSLLLMLKRRACGPGISRTDPPLKLLSARVVASILAAGSAELRLVPCKQKQNIFNRTKHIHQWL